MQISKRGYIGSVVLAILLGVASTHIETNPVKSLLIVDSGIDKGVIMVYAHRDVEVHIRDVDAPAVIAKAEKAKFGVDMVLCGAPPQDEQPQNGPKTETRFE